MANDIPTDGVIWFPGEPKGRDAAGNIIDAPQSPTVDADADGDDHGQLEDVVDQQQENVDTGENQDPAPATENDNSDTTDDDTSDGSSDTTSEGTDDTEPDK